MPGALPELPVFSTASPAVALTLPSQATAAAAPSDSMLSWVLQTLAGQPQAATASGERVMVGDGLPAIPKRLLAKIRNWEYVDLTELLPAADVSVDAENNGPLAARFPLFPGCEVVRHKKRQIQTIAQWIQAFTIYTAALVSAHPSATLELLAYSLTIIKASQQYDGLVRRKLQGGGGGVGQPKMVAAGHGPVHPFFHRQSEAFQPVLRVRQRVTRRR